MSKYNSLGVSRTALCVRCKEETTQLKMQRNTENETPGATFWICRACGWPHSDDPKQEVLT